MLNLSTWPSRDSPSLLESDLSCFFKSHDHLVFMEFKSINTSNWLTRKVSGKGRMSAVISSLALIMGTLFFWFADPGLSQGMPVSRIDVFEKKEYWRLWSSLFAHEDAPHLFGNLFLFFPFSFYLAGYFGFIFFPFAGFFIGGLTNLVVIYFMPERVSLIGASGVVYWMGASWLVLAYLIDRRELRLKRTIKGIGVALILFFPTVYNHQVSYSAHFVGFLFGVLSGVIFYLTFQKKFLNAEIIEHIPVEDVDFDWSPNQQQK